MHNNNDISIYQQIKLRFIVFL
jgi:ribosome-associated protein